MSKDFLSRFPDFFFRILEYEAFQIFFPLLNFQTLEMFPVFPAFPVFLGKKRGNFVEKLLDKKGPKSVNKLNVSVRRYANKQNEG